MEQGNLSLPCCWDIFVVIESTVEQNALVAENSCFLNLDYTILSKIKQGERFLLCCELLLNKCVLFKSAVTEKGFRRKTALMSCGKRDTIVQYMLSEQVLRFATVFQILQYSQSL